MSALGEKGVWGNGRRSVKPKEIILCNVSSVTGFCHEVPSDPWYEPTVEAVRQIARHCRGNGQMFLNETGQETPITLLRTIEDAAMDNVAICLDAANLVLYGKGKPVDALDVLGSTWRAVHAKGGFAGWGSS